MVLRSIWDYKSLILDCSRNKKNTPNATCSERINFTSEEFLSSLRFDQRSRLTELEAKIERTDHHER